VEPERIEKYYKKYLSQAAKEAVVPGFRKGKAPLAMVERMYADRIEDYFQMDVVDDAFGEASKEHDIHYLLYPEVKDIEWEKGKEMVIKIEIETEPQIEFKSLEGLKIPYQPCSWETGDSLYRRLRTSTRMVMSKLHQAETKLIARSVLKQWHAVYHELQPLLPAIASLSVPRN
jgi:trigger factor